MACPSCPQCGSTMTPTKVYTATVCMCSDCGYKVPLPKDKVSSLKEHISKNPKG